MALSRLMEILPFYDDGRQWGGDEDGDERLEGDEVEMIYIMVDGRLVCTPPS